MNPHDALFKSVFAHPHHAAGALRTCLPADVASAIDWAALRLEPGSFVDEQLRDQHSDLLFTAPLHEQSLLLYVLYEHQSTVDPWMPLRLLRYVLRIWEAIVAQHPTSYRLPPVLPVVLHHGETGWTAARSLHELYELPTHLQAHLGPWLPSLQFIVDDLSQANNDELHARAMSALGRLALGSLKHGRRDDGSLAWLRAWTDLVQEVVQAPNGVRALALLLRYILVVNERITPEYIDRALATALDATTRKEVTVTYGDMLIQQGLEKGIQQGLEKGIQQGLEKGIQQGIEKGLQQGIEKGIQQGIEKGLQQGLGEGRLREKSLLLLRLLAKRGLAVSEDERARITGCQSADQLDTWIDRAFDVESTAILLNS